MRSSLIILILAGFLCAGPAFSATAQGAAPEVEIATGPDGLLQMEAEGKVTVRALRGWGRLPDTFVKLAQRMRQEAGLDLLGADLGQIRTWIADEAAAAYRADLQELATFMERGEHLDWSPSAPGAAVPAGTLLRSGGARWTQTADGPVEAPAATADTAPAEAAPVQAEVAQGAGTETASALPPAAPSDAGPAEGVEFPINDQVQGTYRVRLQAEGIT